MTVGKAVATANSYLNVYRATTFTGVSVFLKLHTADPGAAGTTAASAVTTRNAVTFAAASGGSMALTSVSNYSMTTTETITHWSLWDNATAGSFLESGAWTSGVPVVNGSTLQINSLTLSFTPIAA
jgi:hypothetical protein